MRSKKNLKTAIVAGIAISVTNLVSADKSLANPSIDFKQQQNSFGQVNSVSQLRDVQPTDWAYEALRSLVERYGCIVGYSDRTYRGNRPVSRYEFAAGLNSCLNAIEKLVQESQTLAQEDLEIIKRLAQEFEQELAILSTRINNLESRVAFLEDHQFSTNTKLFTQLIFSLNDTFGDGVGKEDDETSTNFGYRIRMNWETSFSEKDTLRVRLQSSNLPSNAPFTGTNMTRVNYDDDSGSQVQIPHVWYRNQLTPSLTMKGGPAGIGYTDLVDVLTPPTIADDSLGVVSKFGEYNPVYRRGGGGLGFNWMFTDNLELSVGYVAGDNNNPKEGNGLFNGTYHALAQLAWYGENAVAGFVYSRSYYPADGNKIQMMADTGSFLANQPFGDSISTTGDFFTLLGYYRITPNFQIHSWGGYVNATANGSGLSDFSDGTGGNLTARVSDGDNASIWYGMVGFSFPDLGKEGSILGTVFGIPPKVSSSSILSEPDTAYHLETFYRFQVNDFIAITPGFWVVINPENNSENQTQWVGYLRTGLNF